MEQKMVVTVQKALKKGAKVMTDTKFVCSVCRNVFSEHRANMNPADQEQIRCPNCGSSRVEPDHFDPDEPLEELIEEPEEEGYGA